MKISNVIFRGLIFLTVLTLTVSCEKTDREELPGFTIENYPRVDGSTSTEPLQTLIACKLLGVESSWVFIPWYKYPYRLVAECDVNHTVCNFITMRIHHSGTHGSFLNLIHGSADLILTARQPSESEIYLADSMGVNLISVPVALDAFVFLNNPHNPVSSITTREIQDIYTGKITNWSELGGENKPIRPYQRNEDSGSQELMKKLVMGDIEMIESPDMIIQGMIGLINQIEYDIDGLGYSINYYTKYMIRSDSIKLLEVDGVYPSDDMIRNRVYPYAESVYAVIREDLEEESSAMKLFEFLKSSTGQEYIRESGYIPYY
jgi:phosphate transport system substrate-binding protein